MKKFIALILFFILLFTQTAFAEIYYSDVFDHWSISDVNYATNVLKVFNGYDDFTFKPENDITRSEFIVILVRTGIKLGIMEESYESTMKYSDMSLQNWSYTYVISFYEHMKNTFKDYTFESIFAGSEFQPNKPITREESIALIGVLCNNSIYDNDITFTDVDKDYKYYKQIKTLYNCDILVGYNDNTVRLSNKITRAESAALIRRIYDDVKLQSGSFIRDLEYLPIKGEDVLSLFGTYSYNTQDDREKKYIKAKNTLEYLDFYGYIFPEDRHLYDSDAIGTLKTLRDEGFNNKSGVNFYLLKYGKLSKAENVALSNDILRDIVKRDDLTDADLTQLINQVSKYNITEALYMDALKKWYDTTASESVKLNIKTYRYAYYIKNGNKTYVKAMFYEDLQAGTNLDRILDINWNVNTEQVQNYLDFSNIIMYHDIYNAAEFMPELDNSSDANVSVLKNIVILDNNTNVDTSGIKNESIYCQYSLNKACIFRYIDESERAFAEMINDYKIIKAMSIYETSKEKIDDNYNAILKFFK